MDSQNFNPDNLLKEIDKSILAKGLIIALIAHAVVVFGTSFGLYKDWAKYGMKTPSAIKAEKKIEQVEAEKARREAEIQRKAAEAAIAASNAVPVSVTAETKALSGKAAPADKGAEAAADAGDGAKKPPEVQPLPPASTDDLSLDDIGI